MLRERSTVSRTPSSAITVAALFALLATLLVAAVPSAVHAEESASLEVVSTRADMVTGGTALVAASLPADTPVDELRVRRNGDDVTESFRPYGDGWLGLVDGLAEGDNRLELVRLVEDEGPGDPGDPAPPVGPACGPATATSGFADAAGPHVRSIDCLLAQGITVGVSDTRFGTSDPLRRRQLALMIVRTLERVPGFELPAPRPEAFNDVPADAFADAIATLAGFEPPVVQGFGDGSFRPAGTLTRGQFASILVRVDDELADRSAELDPLPAPGASTFPDVAPGDPHGPTILRLADAGIIAGFVDGTFGPQRAVTRGQLATLLVGVLDRWAEAGVLPPVGGEGAATASAATASGTTGEEEVLATLELTNHPITGPILSGPHQEPFVCTTESWGLGAPLDEDCSAPTQVLWRYRTTGGAWADWPADGSRPANLATTEVDGAEVDYIVRLERGTINRAVYEIASLGDPAVPGSENPLYEDVGTSRDNPLWNGRLVYSFGGGCNAGYHQGPANNLLGGGVLDDLMLRQGYAVASSTLNVNQNNCNDVLSAETALMVKERFIESYGPVEHTIGWGGSGGAIQQHLIAENYPGILDGIVPQISYPDNFSIAPGVVDCRLLNQYFQRSGQEWSAAERTAISGFATWETCTFWNFAFTSNIVPSVGCDPVVGANHPIYHPVNAPDGVRCTMLDHVVNLLGRDPDTGFARSPFDNHGVQYGLQALEDGDISVEQFLDLNEGIGGYDVDANNVPERSVGDAEALRRILEGGRVITGSLGLSEVPILDIRAYTDRLGDIHDSYRSYTTRERLRRANGHADNHVMWVGSLPTIPADALRAMDGWLTAIGADDRDLSPAERVVANKPTDLVDGCWLPDGTRVDEPLAYEGEGTCAERYPTHRSPRIVAGMEGPVDEVAACATTAPDPDDYGVAFTPAQWERLLAIFPDGVCDYEAGNRVTGEPRGTWQSFRDGPG